MFKKLAVAVAFSPTGEAVLAESLRLKKLFDAEMVLIHIGAQGKADIAQLDEMLSRVGVSKEEVILRWEDGNPSKKILEICTDEDVDLLVAGALRKENLFQYYIGSVARDILRKANCSVMVLVSPSSNPQNMDNIVVQCGGGRNPRKSLKAAVELAKKDQSSIVHLIREIKLYGLSLAVASEDSEEEYSETRKSLVNEELKEVQEKLNKLNVADLRVNIKITAGKAGHELAKFTRRTNADLLVMQGMGRKLGLFDRIFRQDLEYIMSDLPSNLLIVHP
ncbi:universal stress protein [Persicobacter psychrovividus]|uniref:UspA domain-containing protein n=1 Tax=Persicobacter psychrovividus TaxID=387638 RepID=A0ABN6L475_9BACT|nr:hypothetical protein PEPS_01280 [Persicobacter psychrovividus]